MNEWLMLRSVQEDGATRKVMLNSDDLYSGEISRYQPLPVTVHCTDGDYIEEAP
jgi:hypothetical protein